MSDWLSVTSRISANPEYPAKPFVESGKRTFRFAYVFSDPSYGRWGNSHNRENGFAKKRNIEMAICTALFPAYLNKNDIHDFGWSICDYSVFYSFLRRRIRFGGYSVLGPEPGIFGNGALRNILHFVSFGELWGRFGIGLTGGRYAHGRGHERFIGGNCPRVRARRLYWGRARTSGLPRLLPAACPAVFRLSLSFALLRFGFDTPALSVYHYFYFSFFAYCLKFSQSFSAILWRLS